MNYVASLQIPKLQRVFVKTPAFFADRTDLMMYSCKHGC